MNNYYLAIDIGASSGRHILGHLEDGKLQMEEIHRFENGLAQIRNEACWDTKKLFKEIITGLKKCKNVDKIPVSVGVDTWGVDFVLLGKNGEVLGNTVGYRDMRTKGMDQKVYEIIDEVKLYERTGIQKQIFNTIYQLMAIKEKKPEHMEQAEVLLFMPDYFHYLLTGVCAAEYTNATTSQLVNPVTKDWDMELIEMLGYNRRIFQEMKTAGSILGGFTDAIKSEVGFDCKVVLPATHDTASAVLAVPSKEDETLYISSGTWSLMGVERMEADCSCESKALNFTNEGGYRYRFRYLKNIMGLWMIQSLKKELNDQYSFAELCKMAEGAAITSIVNCNDTSFLAPESMRKAVQEYCRNTGQKEPHTNAELACVIYNSLADCYGKTVKEIESMTNVSYKHLHIVGGGANASYLNALTAKATGKTVLAGPTEATAIGNLLVQMLQEKEFKDLKEARQCIYHSFEMMRYEPLGN